VTVFLFPGSNFLIKKVMRFENGKLQGTHFSRVLNNFKSNLEQLKTTCELKLTPNYLVSMRQSKINYYKF
jgi:hypothetical protein